MTQELAPGKWRRLRSLSDEQGRFRMLAIDQRGSLTQAIAKVSGKSPDQVTYDDLANTKEVITRVLAPYATAVLIDPQYGYPHSYKHLPPGVGLLLTYEESGYNKAGPSGKERTSYLIEGWSVAEAQRAGADAVKLLVHYRPDGSEEVRRFQEDLVQRVGEECAEADMPFVLELLSYAVDEPGMDSPEYARKKPDLVIESAAEFSEPKYQVDVLKLEFPADLRHTQEFSAGAFDGRARQPVYSLSAVRDFCRRLDEATGTPWVILSAGVGIEEFLVQTDLATEAGASGYLCGRAIWKDAINSYPDYSRMERWLEREGVYNAVRAAAFAHRARPWFDHRRFQ
jgi:tagatose 1,6-diphosphate aldolase